MRHKFWVKSSLSLFLLIISLTCLAKDESPKLTQVLNKIQNLKHLLLKHQSEQADLQKNLQKTELAINHLTLALQKTSFYLGHQYHVLSELTTQQQKLKQRIKKQQITLLHFIRTTYLLGLNEHKLKALLKAKDPDKINRLLTYYHYLSLQQHHLITNLKQDLSRLNKNKQLIAIHANHLAETKKNQALQQKELDVNKRNQHTVLDNLTLQVKTQTQQLAQLLKNKKNLEKVINSLQKKQAYSPQDLTHLTGQFPWPASGRIIEKFGSNIQNSELKQNGVLIQAPEGQKVYTVAKGKVIFANWMPGYGLLLIIDHGKGYMTLYGNNGVLYKKCHDLVKDHELVATVGHTGGQQKSALYFALRYKGKAIDPSSWCK